MKTYDAIIIGFGKAGKTLAAFLASQGEKVALIEKSEKMYGGTCINIGCIPSKSLVKASKEASIMENDWVSKQDFYHNAIIEKNGLTSMLRQKNFDKLISAGVDIYNGAASFIDDNTIKVSGTEIVELKGNKIFINTGAASFLPPIKGIENSRIFTSESLMDLEELPKKLVIVGGGYIGLEFASIYSGFGSKVVVLQDLADFLPREDEDIAAEILKALKAKGIEFHFGVKVEEFINEDKAVTVKFSDKDNSVKNITADAVLVATGRRPNIKELNLEKAHINVTKFGAVEVDKNLQTSNPAVWATGDVTGGLQFTYISLDDFRVIKSQLWGDKTYTTEKRENIPYSVFITPAYSRVGMNEKEAINSGHNIKIAKLPVAAIPKAQVLKETTGMLKAVIDVDNDKILGAMLFCPESYELINIIKLAMDSGISYQILGQNIYTHPTMAESFNDLFGTL